MEAAIAEARRAAEKGQYALGAVVVTGAKIVAIAHTNLHETNDPSAHAEMNAIRKAADAAGSRYLEGAWLYTTQEPCPMCTSVAIWAKMEGIVFGAFEKDALDFAKARSGSGKFSWRQIEIPTRDVIAKGMPKLKLVEGFLREECLKLHELGQK